MGRYRCCSGFALAADCFAVYFNWPTAPLVMRAATFCIENIADLSLEVGTIALLADAARCSPA